MLALVYMAKEVEKDNYEKGCHGGLSFLYDEKFTVYFNDTAELKKKLGQWASERFDVKAEDFASFVNNEIENDRFDYNQSEDAEGRFTTITEDNPDGYLAFYTFWIKGVYQEVEYTF